MKDRLLDYLKDKDIAILGFGKEGKSSYKFLRQYFHDKKIKIYDSNPKIKEDILLKNDKNLEVKNVYTYEEILENCDIMLKSPAITLTGIEISKYLDKITSQIALLLEYFDITTIGITGTKGKSTTTSLIYEVLKDQKENVLIGGNIGIPVFDNIEKITENSIYVIEMSAYQLEFIKKSPKISLILNLFEEHLDYFKTLDNYYKAKINIAKYQDEDSVLFYKGDNSELVKQVKGNIKGKSYQILDEKPSNQENIIYIRDGFVYLKEEEIEEKIYDTNDKRILLGDNNLRDIMFVLGVSKYLNLDMQRATYVINNFKGLPHRMEYVGNFDDVFYYNDAIATIPEATINNIETLGEVDTLIFGGMDRKISYTKLIDYLKTGKVRNLICMPETGTKIGKIIQENNKNSNVYFAENLEDAVAKAKEVTKKEKICIMSPAAPSYNQFKDFEEKGNKYKELIQKISS